MTTPPIEDIIARADTEHAEELQLALELQQLILVYRTITSPGFRWDAVVVGFGQCPSELWDALRSSDPGACDHPSVLWGGHHSHISSPVFPLDPDKYCECALCGKLLWWSDTWSPADDAICAECDTEVTGRPHPPSLHPATAPEPINA